MVGRRVVRWVDWLAARTADLMVARTVVQWGLWKVDHLAGATVDL